MTLKDGDKGKKLMVDKLITVATNFVTEPGILKSPAVAGASWFTLEHAKTFGGTVIGIMGSVIVVVHFYNLIFIQFFCKGRHDNFKDCRNCKYYKKAICPKGVKD